MNKKNFAIIGCGRIGLRRAQQIMHIANVKAVCDIVPAKANELAKEFAATAYYSIESLLASEPDLDLVSICTPNGLHALQTIKALEAGINVLCEKPLCINAIDGAKMIEAAAAVAKKLFVVKSSRYTPVVLAVKELLQNNKLGKIYSFQLNCVWSRLAAYYADSWRGTTNLDGGTLFTQFSHYIDVLLWFLGDEKSVTGFRKNAAHNNIIDFEDTGVVAVEMLSGAVGVIHYSVNAFNKNQEVSLTLIAEHGTIKLGGEYMNELVYQQPQLIDTTLLVENNPANDYGFYKGSMSNHDKVYQNVLLALNGQKSSITDGADGLRTVSFIEKIYQQIHL